MCPLSPLGTGSSEIFVFVLRSGVGVFFWICILLCERDVFERGNEVCFSHAVFGLCGLCQPS